MNQTAEEVNLLIDLGADVEAVNRWQMTSLQYAADNNKPAAIRVIFNKGGDLENKAVNDKTPLGIAVEKKMLSAITELVKLGAKTEGIGIDDFNITQAIEEGLKLRAVIEGKSKKESIANFVFL